VAGLAILLRERVVRDLPYQRLDERVLAAFGAQRVALADQELASNQGLEARLEDGIVDAGHRRETRAREALAEHGRIQDERPIRPIERVEAGGNQGSQRRRHG